MITTPTAVRPVGSRYPMQQSPSTLGRLAASAGQLAGAGAASVGAWGTIVVGGAAFLAAVWLLGGK